jgi:DNA-binding phage protein
MYTTITYLCDSGTKGEKMNTIIDVDYMDGFKLILTFNNGVEGIVDLKELFTKEPLNCFSDDFLSFSLTSGTLRWGEEHISPDYLWEIAENKQVTNNVYVDPNNPLAVITKAFQESLEEDDPTILQAALRGYAEKIGMSNLIKDSEIKSRTSAYKSLSQSGSPKWETIVKLANSIIKLANEDSINPIQY